MNLKMAPTMVRKLIKNLFEVNMKLHLGCGEKIIKGFINVDIQKNQGVDLVSDISSLPFKESTIDLIYACNVLEHFGRSNKSEFFSNDWKIVLKYWISLLKPGGEIYLSVPDFEKVCNYYIKNKNINDLLGFVVGGQNNKYDIHGMIFDEKTIREFFQECGLKEIKRYDWRDFEPFKIDSKFDDYSRSYLPHMDFEKGELMMLNITGRKYENKSI